MFRPFVVSATLLMGALVTVAAAQQMPMIQHQGHMATPAPDGRETVQFPPDMQTNFLGNMRDHMQTLDGIIQAIAADDYATASRLAVERLGLNSPSAQRDASRRPPGKPPRLRQAQWTK